ncbi:hypothetical protein BLOT_005793 [Blomia tropicalis]|nr:hypothetical protein BLOT_005793 [Blomia tropicalis]
MKRHNNRFFEKNAKKVKFGTNFQNFGFVIDGFHLLTLIKKANMNYCLFKTLVSLVLINILFNAVVVENQKIYCPPSRWNETPQDKIFRKTCKENKFRLKHNTLWKMKMKVSNFFGQFG